MKRPNRANVAKAGRRATGAQSGSRQVVEQSIEASKDGRQLTWEMSAATGRPVSGWDNQSPAAGERSPDRR